MKGSLQSGPFFMPIRSRENEIRAKFDPRSVSRLLSGASIALIGTFRFAWLGGEKAGTLRR
jgi:hypothetical protein